MSTPPALADTIRTHETPEGVRLRLRLAGPVVRACAWAIDLVIRLLLYALVVGIFAFFGGVGTALMLISFFLLEWFYPVVFEISGGATPGKRAMGLVVIHDNGTPVALPSSLIRNLLRGADFLPLLYAAGLLSMLVSRDFQRLGDLAAGTLVVYREREPERAELPWAVSVRPPAALSVGEQRELIEFAERSARLSPGRQVELAELLRGITGKQGDAAVCELHSYAQCLTPGALMRQEAFEQRHQSLWDTFSRQLDELERPRLRRRPEQGAGLPERYRRVCNHYALARERRYSPALVEQLHRLVLRGHQQLYTRRGAWMWRLLAFIANGFPRALRRQAGYFWFALFLLPALLIGVGCMLDEHLVYSVMGEAEVEQMESMYRPDNEHPGRTLERGAESDFSR